MDKNQLKTFLEIEESSIPGDLERKTLSEIKVGLIEEKKIARKKLFFYQIIGPALSLFICPQYGVGPLKNYFDLSHSFMSVGSWACAIFCGLMFMGVGSLFSLLLITKKEHDLLVKDRYFVGPIVMAVFYSYFMLMSSSHSHTTLSFTFWWALAGILSYLLLVNRKIKQVHLLGETFA